MPFNSTNSNQSQSSSSNKNQITEDDANAQNKNDLVIFVDKDSGDKLEELFNKALGNKLPLQVPFKMRKLPPSFFNPPSSGSKSPSCSHSRENSADSAFGSGTTIGSNTTATTPSSGNNQNVSQPPIAPSAIPSGLVVHHSRAHSSPASLGKLPLNLNINLNSLNLGTVTPTNASLSPSPDHTAATGTTTKRTTNSSESSTASVGGANATKNSNSVNSATTTTNQQAQPQQAQSQTNSHNNLPHNILDRTLQHIHSRGRSYDIPSLQQQIQFGELPPGWEQAKTQDGRIYYIK